MTVNITLKIFGFLVANKLWNILTFRLIYQVVSHLQMLKVYLKQQFSHLAAGSRHTTFISFTSWHESQLIYMQCKHDMTCIVEM